MISDSRRVLVVVWLLLVLAYVAPVISADTDPLTKASIEYSHDPATVLISFREVFPEFADQDPTPLIRIYGDGRVVVFHPAYMKQAGQYEMLLNPGELEDLLLQITPVLFVIDVDDLKRRKNASDELLRQSMNDAGELILFHDSDAEVSIFELNIDIYRPDGLHGRAIYKPGLSRSWRGLRVDARDYIGIKPIQDLMQTESILRALSKRDALVPVESLP